METQKQTKDWCASLHMEVLTETDVRLNIEQLKVLLLQLETHQKIELLIKFYVAQGNEFFRKYSDDELVQLKLILIDLREQVGITLFDRKIQQLKMEEQTNEQQPNSEQQQN